MNVDEIYVKSIFNIKHFPVRRKSLVELLQDSASIKIAVRGLNGMVSLIYVSDYKNTVEHLGTASIKAYLDAKAIPTSLHTVYTDDALVYHQN